MIEKNIVDKYIENIKELGRSNALFDMHVHPFEVIFGNIDSFCNKKYGDQCRHQKYPYSPPQTESLDIIKINKNTRDKFDFSLKAKYALLTFRRLYLHSCMKVFEDHMTLSGVDKALLLPVFGPEETGDEKMELMKTTFGNNNRFYFGYCVPNNIKNEFIDENIKENVLKYDIKCLKLHPNITDINLYSKKGVERVENILNASEKNKLKVIVHGGRSPVLNNKDATSYSIISNLEKIDWSITHEPVIIAHAGAFGHDTGEIEGSILPTIRRMMAKYINLYIDLSGIDFKDICLILKTLDMDKIVFGSDAFYEHQWKGLVKLFVALERVSLKVEEAFLKISSFRPAQFFPERLAGEVH